MRRPLTDEDATERAAIDGRVAFAIAAFVGMAALVALLDRIGLPERLVRLFSSLIVLGGLAITGTLLRSMRISRFYAAGRAVPVPYVGFGMAALTSALVLPFAPPSPDVVFDAPLAAGGLCGCSLAALVVGPYLRKTGAFSLSDLAGRRFSNAALRLGLAVIVAACGAAVGVAGYEIAATTLTDLLRLDRTTVSAALAFVLVLVAVPGGLSGIVWSANGAGGLLLAGIGLPIVMLLWRGEMPLPWVGVSPVWRAAAAQIAAWQGSVNEGSSAALSTGGALVASLGIACGLASLGPLLALLVAARDGATAVRSGLVSLVWTGVAVAVVSMALVWGAATFSRAVIGQLPDRLPDTVYAASGAGLVEICGGHPDSAKTARQQCLGRTTALGLSSDDARPLGPLYLIGLTSAAGAGATGAGLMAAALIALGLCLAASGFLVCATALGHDLFYRVRDRTAQTSRRLAVTRALLVLIVGLGAVLAGTRDDDPRLLIALAMTLSAAGVLPLIVLSIWARANGTDAVVALLAGLAGAEAVLFSGVPTLPVLAQAAAIGAVAGTGCGLLASLLHAPGNAENRAFVDAVLQREGDVFAPDKGA